MVMVAGEGPGGSRGPLPTPSGAACVSGIVTLRRFVLSSFFSASFCSAFPSLLFGSLTARAPFCCTRSTEVDVDGGMHHQVRFLCFANIFIVKLKASMPDTPLWRLLVSRPCLHLFFGWQASVPGNTPVRYVLLYLDEASRSNLLSPPPGPTLEPRPAEESAKSLPMLLPSSSSSPFRVRGRPRC